MALEDIAPKRHEIQAMLDSIPGGRGKRAEKAAHVKQRLENVPGLQGRDRDTIIKKIMVDLDSYDLDGPL